MDILKLLTPYLASIAGGFIPLILWFLDRKRLKNKLKKEEQENREQLQDFSKNISREVDAIEKASDNTLVFPAKHGIDNNAFYSHFQNVFKGAESSIFMTGRGLKLEGARKSAIKTIDDYFKVIADSLYEKRDLKFYRLQYGMNADKKWCDKLLELKEKYPDQVYLYLLKEDVDYDMLHVASVDADSPDKCVVEIMVPAFEKAGKGKSEKAGSAIFIAKEQEIAISIRDRINSVIESEKCISMETKEDFEKCYS